MWLMFLKGILVVSYRMAEGGKSGNQLGRRLWGWHRQ